MLNLTHNGSLLTHEITTENGMTGEVDLSKTVHTYHGADGKTYTETQFLRATWQLQKIENYMKETLRQAEGNFGIRGTDQPPH